MSLFDGKPQPAPSKVFFYIKIALAVVALILLAGFFAEIAAPGPVHLFWYHSERNRVASFLSAVVVGDMQKAYQIWGPQEGYSYKDFLEDWGPDGYYGPVKSYMLSDADHPKDGSGVIIIAEVSRYSKFPAGDIAADTKEVKIWVQYGDKALSFSPM